MTDPADSILAQIFPTLSAESRSRLQASARISSHPADVTLCNEGDVEHCFYVILGGRVDVFKILEGQRLHINQLKAGDHFGDIALLLDRPRTATIITAEATRVLEIDRTIFSALLETHPAIVVALTQLVLRRLLAQEEKHLTEIARLKKRDAPPGKVFVSYARADHDFVARMTNTLLKEGIDIWMDSYRLEHGRSWARQVGEALDRCHMLLVVLSPASVASENVDDEWNYYLDQKKPIVVVLHQPCKVPYRLSKLHYVDFHEAEFTQAMARLTATLIVQT